MVKRRMENSAHAAGGGSRDENSAGSSPGAAGSLQLTSLDVRIAPNRIHFLKFILEGYDGLAVLSTLDSQLGQVRLRFAVKLKDELFALLRGLAPQLGGVDWLEELNKE